MPGEEEVNNEYYDGRSSHGMKGTVVPSARKGDRENSGVRFDPKNPRFAHNIVETGEDGVERRVGISAETQEKIKKGLRRGDNVNYDELMKKGSAPVESSDPPLDNNAPTTSIDDSVPDTEETLTLPRTMRPSPSPSPMPAPEPVPEPEPVREEPEDEPAPAAEPAEALPVEANKPVSKKPKDLDKEPDPDPGPEQISSYTVEKNEEGEVQPLLAPVETPGGAEESDDDGLERNMDADLGEMPDISTRAPESKGRPLKRPNVNLGSAPMKVQRVKVRFISALGKLAIPYNLVFRYDINLVMIQYSEEGIFYDPPQVAELEIEVWWHGKVFICYPGTYFEFPDGQTSQTIFLIDEDKTRAKREELRKKQ